MSNAWIWIALTFVLLVTLVGVGGYMHERRNRNKTAKMRDLERGAQASAAGMYRLKNQQKFGKPTVGLSKSKIGKPQHIQIPAYAVVTGNHFTIPSPPPRGPRRAVPPPAPRSAPSAARAVRVAPRPVKPQVRIPVNNYNYNQSMGPISPMNAGNWAAAHGRHSAVSAVGSRF